MLTIRREFGEQGGVPDRIESSRYVLGDGSDLMSGIEDLHPLFGKQKQHVKVRVTWSESKLMTENQAIGEAEGFNARNDDGFHDLADDWEQTDWSIVAGICFCTFLCRVVMFADLQVVDR